MVTSDPVPLALSAFDTVTVSIYCAKPTEMSGHDWANRTAWSTLPAIGDLTSDESGVHFRPFGTSWAWVDAIDVLDADVVGAVVALGDSITDGAGSEFGTDTRWTDFLAERLLSLPVGDVRRRAVANAGIGGNTLAGQGTLLSGINARSRLGRDVLSLSRVSDVVVFIGTNDLSDGESHARVIRDLTSVAERIHSAGSRALVATIAPRRGGYCWGDANERQRRLVSDWIHNQTTFDAVLDFEAVLDDPDSPGRIRPDLSADRTHPNSAGYRAIAWSVDLNLFAPVEARLDCGPPGQAS